ncbi:hypothetical protein EDB89DRAFT_1922458 [Lactarius sanguifluus]|nr:hypothetical protein EDB89DRAFT_1922458 [Lactarius sanguifluus]
MPSTIGRLLSYPALLAVSWPLRSGVCHYYTCRLLVFFFRFALVFTFNTDTSRSREERSIRYDARLLDALPTVTVSAMLPHVSLNSPGGGWSDLPSDSEDSFFLTPDETADLHRTKRMRHLDALHTAHMRALSLAPCLDDDDDAWDGSDEEVSPLAHFIYGAGTARRGTGDGGTR